MFLLLRLQMSVISKKLRSFYDRAEPLTSYLPTQDLVQGVEAASSRQLCTLKALLVEVNGDELVAQFVQLSGLHHRRGFHLLDVLHAGHTHSC